MVVTGDLSQVDLPSGYKSGLSDALDVLKDIKDACFVGLAMQTLSAMIWLRRSCALTMPGDPGGEPLKGNGSSIDIDMMVDAAAWREALPALISLVDRTLLAVWRRAGDDSPAEASLVLSSDAEMRKLNFQHRAVDRPTNVLAFPLGEPMQPDGPRHLGDIVLNMKLWSRPRAMQSPRRACDPFAGAWLVASSRARS